MKAFQDNFKNAQTLFQNEEIFMGTVIEAGDYLVLYSFGRKRSNQYVAPSLILEPVQGRFAAIGDGAGTAPDAFNDTAMFGWDGKRLFHFGGEFPSNSSSPAYYPIGSFLSIPELKYSVGEISYPVTRADAAPYFQNITGNAWAEPLRTAEIDASTKRVETSTSSIQQLIGVSRDFSVQPSKGRTQRFVFNNLTPLKKYTLTIDPFWLATLNGMPFYAKVIDEKVGGVVSGMTKLFPISGEPTMKPETWQIVFLPYQKTITIEIGIEENSVGLSGFDYIHIGKVRLYEL